MGTSIHVYESEKSEGKTSKRKHSADDFPGDIQVKKQSTLEVGHLFGVAGYGIKC